MRGGVHWRTDPARRSRALAALRRGDLLAFRILMGCLEALETVVGDACRRQRCVLICKDVPIWDVRAHVQQGVVVECAG